MPDGKSRTRASRSSRSANRSEATATTSSNERTATPRVFAIEPMQRTLAQMRERRPNGTRAWRPSRLSLAPRRRHVSAAAIIVTGTMAQKATRHSPCAASAPPRAGPPRAAVPQAAELLNGAAGDHHLHGGGRAAHDGAHDERAGGEKERAPHPRATHHDRAPGAPEDRADRVGRGGPRVEFEASDLDDGRRQDRGRDERRERGRQDAQD